MSRANVEDMEIPLSFEQRARLELLAIHAGVSTSQLLLDAAQLVLDRDAAEGRYAPKTADIPVTQRFLSEVELQTRFARLLQE